MMKTISMLFARGRRPVIAIPFLVLLVSLSLASCGGKEPERPQAESAATETVKPVALIEPSAGPRWFELSAAGPVAIRGPGEASLAPFEPWPLARRVVGFVLREGLVAMGSNRDGFVAIVARKDGRAAVYRADDPERYGPYSMAAVFSYNGAPAALLYRDRFFVDPTVPPAVPNVITLVPGNPRPVGVDIGALAGHSGKDGWDIESLDRAADGEWRFRAVRAENGGGQIAYLAAADLQSTASPSSAAAFRKASDPRPLDEADPVLRRALAEAVSLLGSGEAAVATSLAPGQASVAYYLLSKAAGAAGAADVGRAWACSDGARAFAAFPDGRLFAAIGTDGPLIRTRLPALPEKYAYTGLAATASLLVAAWEEQDGWAVGAAGFVVVSSELAQSEG